MSPAVHAACLGLVAIDLAARAARIAWIARGIGARLSFRDAFVLNAWGDAASALTPLRLGGEPARLAGLLAAGVPAPAALAAIGVEVLAAWPVIIATMAPMIWHFAPEWWRTAAPAIAQGARDAWPWLAGIGLVTVATWIVARRYLHPVRQVEEPVRKALAHARALPVGTLLATVPLTLANLVCRTGVLVVLALSLPDAPPLGTLVVGSFALLYAQLVLPTPSGAGVVDFTFLVGGAGDFGARAAGVLVAWRFYTSGIGIVLGLGLGLLRLRTGATRRASPPSAPSR
ncbi:MAG TPA: lysylphosphatidylglycerol synthase domain-containing protein [Gemmatimonadales bacterium]